MKNPFNEFYHVPNSKEFLDIAYDVQSYLFSNFFSKYTTKASFVKRCIQKILCSLPKVSIVINLIDNMV